MVRIDTSQLQNFKLIEKVNVFPIDIKQFSPLWCIPATIEAVLKYHDPALPASQLTLVDNYRKEDPGFDISFHNIVERVLISSYGDHFEFEVKNH